VKAAVRDRYGPPTIVRVEEVPRPEPAEDELLVRVEATSINRADIDGLYPRWQFSRVFTGFRRPRSPWMGEDVAGVVEAVGPAATRFRPGDRVFADLFTSARGSFAEFITARERVFLPIPDGLSFEDAATLPHSGVLAAQGLRTGDGRTVQPGERVLVVGASGNVGPFAVQIAKARGAEVTGVSSADKADFVRSLGADRVLDYRTVDPARTGDRYDWIVDVDAHASLLHWRGALTRNGVYRAMGGSTAWLLQTAFLAPALRLARGRPMGLLLWKPFAEQDVDTLTALIREGWLRPAIDRRFPLDDIVDALRWVDDGRARGKILVLPRGVRTLA
jgi:NADPH:quinone reductase-like Zn-dependent oxidoreductase